MAGPGKSSLVKKALATQGNFKKPVPLANKKTVPSTPRRSLRLSPLATNAIHEEQPRDYPPMESEEEQPLPQNQILRRSVHTTPRKKQAAFRIRDEEENEFEQDQQLDGLVVESGEDQPLHKKQMLQKSVRTTPRKKQAAFQIRDEEENESEQDQPTRRSVRQRMAVRGNVELEVNIQNQSMASSTKSSGQSIEAPSETESSQQGINQRGITRNLRCTKQRDPETPLNIEVDWKYGRLVGKDCQQLITGGGCVMRQFAAFDGKTWKHQDANVKDKIVKNFTDGTNYDGSLDVQTIISKQLGNQFRSKQYSLHMYFKRFNSMEDALQNVPEGLSKEEWTKQCHRFVSEKFLETSAINKENRAKNKVPPGTGSKSIARVVHDMKKVGKQVSDIDAYEMAHFSKKKGKMVNENAQQMLDSLREVESSSSMTPSQIWSAQTKEKNLPGHIKGRAAPKKQLQLSERMQEQIDMERKRAHEAEERAASLEAMVKAQNEQLEALKEEQSRTNAKMDLFMAEWTRMCQSH